ncbi:mitogen activated protein kinase 2 [Microbotryomycetes sp. JL201]|nr:mitogen activated protein kinase 2 [Microbotryomycetes sp. JL201]
MAVHRVDRHRFPVLNEEFLVDSTYEFVKELGQGAYGVVCSAKSKTTGDSIAIKKVTKVFQKKILTKRALRELKLLHHFRGHKNITCLYDMDLIDPVNFDSVYLYEELMEADLHAIIRSGQPLSDAHFQSFIYQTLCGLKYIHSAGVLHRDLKPGNLLVNADCELKICDFGLARGFESNPDVQGPGAAGFMTEPMFKGANYIDQLNIVLHFLGTPSDATLRRVGSPRAQDYIRSLPYKTGVPFQQVFPKANPVALDMLSKLLAFDPAERISCEQALEHPYLAVWHDPSDEPICPHKFDFGFESEESTEGMRRLIVEEVETFRRMVRPPTRSNSGPRRQESLPVPTRDEIMASPGGAGAAMDEAEGRRMVYGEPEQEEPGKELERELSGRN